jgi:5-methylcytosine-specific restriction protein B
LAAGEYWRDTALLSERSIFTGENIWSTANIELLDSAFTQNPDDSDRTFITKLHDQLSYSPADIKQLAAEVVWLLLLCPNNNSVEGKRKNIETIWSWSEKPFPTNSPWLTDAVLSGIGSGGRAFGSLRPLELTFCLNVLLSFRKLPKDQQASLVKSPWGFAEWLQQVPDAQARQFRAHVALRAISRRL